MYYSIVVLQFGLDTRQAKSGQKMSDCYFMLCKICGCG